jgi:hypothetical protein
MKLSTALLIFAVGMFRRRRKQPTRRVHLGSLTGRLNWWSVARQDAAPTTWRG